MIGCRYPMLSRLSAIAQLLAAQRASLPWLDAGYTSLLIENGTMQRSVRPWQYDASIA